LRIFLNETNFDSHNPVIGLHILGNFTQTLNLTFRKEFLLLPLSILVLLLLLLQSFSSSLFFSYFPSSSFFFFCIFVDVTAVQCGRSPP
jgi:hypothetical protein